MTGIKDKKSARMRKAVYCCVLSLLFVLAAPLIPYVIDAHAEDVTSSKANKPVALQHPGINLWNDVRQRNEVTQGSSQVKGVDSGILINKTGEDWRRFRMEMLMPYGAYFMAAIVTAIVLFFLLRGKLRLPGGRSGELVCRFTLNQRTAHWFAVGIFWLLGITGLILLYGRFVLIPLLGADGFSITASACKEMHNLIGPLFLLAVLALLVLYIKDNFFNRDDITWITKGGGMFGGHVSAARFNAGEKTWFWLVMIFGFLLCITGLILDFSVFGQGREIMALSHVIHGISALILITVSFGHIYLGTIGVEGTLEGMTTGYVDANWAKSHHDLWYEEMSATAEEQQGIKQSVASSSTKPASSPAGD
ncbi:MAG: formate dehydrogenase subunit gamma [Gammaproteobacteria bacterium]|nr:formate dehydrogenase subunit gamma [Gammaproteobacteria bacterium]